MSKGSKFFAPPITTKELYFQDKRRMDWDTKERKIEKELATYYRRKGRTNER